MSPPRPGGAETTTKRLVFLHDSPPDWGGENRQKSSFLALKQGVAATLFPFELGVRTEWAQFSTFGPISGPRHKP